MITPATLNNIAGKLRNLASYIESTAIDSLYEVSIGFSDIRLGYPKEALGGLKAWSSTNARYIYQVSATENQAERLYDAFKNAKESGKNNRAYCRLNNASQLLYVGSSSSLDSRIKQHLGFGNKGTYAMQLSHWLPDEEGVLHIHAWRFSEETDNAVVQAIEDGMWAASKPMFGRQGAR